MKYTALSNRECLARGCVRGPGPPASPSSLLEFLNFKLLGKTILVVNEKFRLFVAIQGSINKAFVFWGQPLGK